MDEMLTDFLTPKWEPNEIINMFREEQQKIVQRGDECKALLRETDSVLKEAQALKNLHLYVLPKASQLHSQCKSIIQERNDLKESYDRINSTLNRQEELRSIYKRMPDIKNQIFSILNNVLQGYQARQQQQQQATSNPHNEPEGTPLDEYYGRFFIECRRIKELTNQLESCLCNSKTNELLLHLEEIYTLYFDIREQLIAPVFNKSLETLVARANRNYCDLLQQSCASLIRILRNEIQLFNQIFSTNDLPASLTPPISATTQPETPPIVTSSSATNSLRKDYPVKRQIVNNFLEMLCKSFYEHLRPVIIHINHLETLTELYKLLVENIRHEYHEGSFQATISSLAEDIQERLVFRTEIFIQESIIDYKPSSGDLAYPEKLELIPGGGDLKEYQSMWYPTVQRTVLALLYLSRVFDPLTFTELAQEVVVACLKSLDLAQRLIDQRHGGTKIEATLFLSKHLSIIKDQLQSYGINGIEIPPEISPELISIFDANQLSRADISTSSTASNK